MRTCRSSTRWCLKKNQYWNCNLRVATAAIVFQKCHTPALGICRFVRNLAVVQQGVKVLADTLWLLNLRCFLSLSPVFLPILVTGTFYLNSNGTVRKQIMRGVLQRQGGRLWNCIRYMTHSGSDPQHVDKDILLVGSLLPPVMFADWERGVPAGVSPQAAGGSAGRGEGLPAHQGGCAHPWEGIQGGLLDHGCHYWWILQEYAWIFHEHSELSIHEH